MGDGVSEEGDALRVLHERAPELFGQGTLLYVGAHPCRAHCARALQSAGRQMTLLEVWGPNCDFYREQRPDLFCRVIHGDVRDARAWPFFDFDAVLWWHGPEHIPAEDLAATLAHLEEIAPLVVLGCPWGAYKQGPVYGNPHEEHKQSIYPSQLEKLGYQVTRAGRADDPLGLLVAVRRRGGG